MLALPVLLAVVCTYRCECAPFPPFEGEMIYGVETCDGKENWIIFDRHQYDAGATCKAAVLENEVCKSLVSDSR